MVLQGCSQNPVQGPGKQGVTGSGREAGRVLPAGRAREQGRRREFPEPNGESQGVPLSFPTKSLREAGLELVLGVGMMIFLENSLRPVTTYLSLPSFYCSRGWPWLWKPRCVAASPSTFPGPQGTAATAPS